MEASLLAISILPLDFNIAKCVLLLVPLAFALTSKTNKAISILLLYYVFMWCISFMAIPIDQRIFKGRGEHLLELITIMAPAMLVAASPTIRLIQTVRLAALLSACATVFQFATGQEGAGLWMNPAVNGSFLALTASIAGMEWPVLIAAALMSGSSTAALGCVIVAGLRVRAPWKLKAAYGAFISVVGVWLAGTQDTGRYKLWGMAIDTLDRSSVMFGQGFGSIASTLEKLQMQTGHMLYYSWIGKQQVTTGFFTNLHNEHLQMLMEGGLIGLALWLSLNVIAIYKAKNKTPIIACLACAFASPILHWTMTAIIYSIAIKEAFKEGEDGSA